MVREVAVAIFALAVTGIRVSASVFALMAIAAQVRLGHALHESVRFVAIGASEIFAAVTVVFGHGRVAGRASQWLCV
jgi:hypothetical protein